MVLFFTNHDISYSLIPEMNFCELLEVVLFEYCLGRLNRLLWCICLFPLVVSLVDIGLHDLPVIHGAIFVYRVVEEFLVVVAKNLFLIHVNKKKKASVAIVVSFIHHAFYNAEQVNFVWKFVLVTLNTIAILVKS